MSRLVAAASLCLVLLVLGSVRTARACWDGYAVRLDNIAFTGADDVWAPARARELAVWARRFEALLGPAGTLEADGAFAEACVDSRCVEVVAPTATPRALFEAVARALAIPAAQRAAALRASASPFAVQVAATRDRAAAERLAARLSDAELPRGFYDAGGFPADNAEVHVIEATAADGRAIYRVVVGAFLDRSDALAHAPEIAAQTGLPVVLRAL